MEENVRNCLLSSLLLLENQIPADSTIFKTCQEIKEKLKSNKDSSEDVIISVSEILFHREYVIVVAKCFRKMLLQILSHIVPLKVMDSTKLTNVAGGKRIHVEICIILGKLINLHPDILQYSLQYFKWNPSPFEFLEDLDQPFKKRKFVNSSLNGEIKDMEVVECCYNFLRAAPEIFRYKWRWSSFIERFILNVDTMVKWMICQCIAILSGMSEIQLHQLEKSLFNGDMKKLRSCMLKYESVKEESCVVDNSLDEEYCSQNMEFFTGNRHVVNVAGILLPVFDVEQRSDGHLVPVKSTQDNLRCLALAVATGKATCLVGPVGCGKTALVEHLAAVTGRSSYCGLRKVQLGDQTDSRTLLGTYRCTDVPGEFVWQPGVLTQAVQKGQWLLLEDVDCAAIDVASVLSSLLERNVLSVPGYRDAIPVAPGFQLFVTQRILNTASGQQKQNSNATSLLQKHWSQINVEPLAKNELVTIVEILFPKLKTIASRMVDVFMLFSVGSHQSSLHNIENEKVVVTPFVNSFLTETSDILSLRSGRLTSTRDLIKWCSRAVINFDVSSHESALKVLQDAIDIFACSVPEGESRIPLAKAISAYLGIVDTKAEYYCRTYKPCISLKPNSMNIGRAVVQRKEIPISSITLQGKKCTFSFTRQSTCLLERIACCVNANEPVLLVGETGTGKTSSVQYLAKETGNKLVVINMNQQSDSADLLGGYKPVDLKFIISPIRNEFESLFRSYYDVSKNAKFLEYIAVSFENSDWKTLLALMKQSQGAAIRRLSNTDVGEMIRSGKKNSTDPNTEADKTRLFKSWTDFGGKLKKLELQLKSETSLAFSFIEGSLVRALRKGYWVLLDEINLASAETLECLSGLLEGGDSSISLLERGDDQSIDRHKDFILFACMNPATDVGKRDLPAGLRNRFTEFFVDELTERNDLLLLVSDYLKDLSVPNAIMESIYKFYVNIRKEAKINLTDGTGQCPHFSLRTLCRALSSAVGAHCGTVTRSLYETMCLSFLTQLDSASHPRVATMIGIAVLGKKNLKSVLNQPIPAPRADKEQFLCIEGYWICQGKLKPTVPSDYVLTPSVRNNLRDLVRIISLGKLPILLQGDTSVGKTSLITYIAKISGNHCVRINNHQHTDLQEYIGAYATDSNGKLVFREGVLVEAMRKGHWIILDELNLAPSDVLEALNRVLDDNRELFIPETQQVVKADPNFMLFATQNPPGLYGGRKLLSRAFRNRFVELHFDEIPRPELETILHQRCHLPVSYCKKIIAVMAELQARRRKSAAVQGKEGFITLRDLFRWGERYKAAADGHSALGKYYDWDQHIADEGYLVLAGRVRHSDEKSIIQDVLQKHLKRTVDPECLFTLSDKTSTVTKDILHKILSADLQEFQHVVWTMNMRMLAVLIAKSFTFKEPVLLVGETGCGKTTICQVLAALNNCKLLSVNCHMHSESADFLGGLRPVRCYQDDGKLFEWVDGPLIDAMKNGQMFLADEISLADDSVLERLNSLLEPERQLLLAEKGLDMEDNSTCIVTAHEEFHFIGTMNPGGDYGKKELSPALRNRFTEIWCDNINTDQDLISVLEKSVNRNITIKIGSGKSSGIGENILKFFKWFKNTNVGSRFPCSIRDLLSWVHFINETVQNNGMEVTEAFIHGANLIFLDSFGTGLSGSENIETLNESRTSATMFLLKTIDKCDSEKMKKLEQLFLSKNLKFVAKRFGNSFGIDPFYIPYGNVGENSTASISSAEAVNFSFTAPTTGINSMRLLRGLQLKKAILLEGSPGVGKTSLVMALAKISGHRILRINLSDQTDISDLFGADLPTPEGTFAWQEGAFLTALQNGDWILLDELNLAPQPVLEGLNACLDHRGEVFIPELCKTFKVKKDTRIFACQNPLRQGGSRRGLPKSFLNRFTQVYVDTLLADDLIFICKTQYPTIPTEILLKMIEMNSKILDETSRLLWGHRGSPWELNLRDIQRWCDSIMFELNKMQSDVAVPETISPGKGAQLLYVNRMRTNTDKEKVKAVYKDIFGPEYPLSNEHPAFYITETHLHIGDVSIERNQRGLNKTLQQDLLVLRNQLPVLKSLIQCVNMNWLAILVGPASSGKNCSVQVLAQLLGKELNILPVVSAMDTSDLLGGFEQTDYNRHMEDISTKIEHLVMSSHRNLLLEKAYAKAVLILQKWETFKFVGYNDSASEHTMEEEVKLCIEKEDILQDILYNLSIIHDKNDKLSKEINGISLNLKSLKETVLKEGNINAGGKFEWVDSLLVKCLLNGSWLLVDNVNLCSSAVLDRLNGLLEPNGVLSIAERGGTLNEIKPHPNFRMFFTMDPKNGEISRAMRNRGVEIYILGPEEINNVSLTEAIPDLDLSAMLSSAGLDTKYHTLFKTAHEKMCSFVQSYNKPSLCQLLQSAFWTSQLILRGEHVIGAIVKSFSDVYIKSRTASDFIGSHKAVAEFKYDMLSDLENFIRAGVSNCESKSICGPFTNHTYSSLKLQKHSSLEIVKHQATFINSAIECINSENMLKISLLLYQFYHLSCKADCILRYELVNNLLSHSMLPANLKSYFENLNKDLYHLVLKDRENDQNQYPWDLQFLPEINTFGDSSVSISNRASICLYYSATKATEKNQITSERFMTALEYSTKVSGGDLTDFSDLPILKHCSKLISALDSAIVNIFSHTDIKLTNEDWCSFALLFNWRNRFYKICKERLLESTSRNSKVTMILRDEVIVKMNMYYKWLSKYLISKLPSAGDANVDLQKIMLEIDQSIITQNSPLRIIGKHLKKYLGQPTPYPSEKVYLACSTRESTIENIDMLNIQTKMSEAVVKNIINGKLKSDRSAFKSAQSTFDFPNECEDQTVNLAMVTAAKSEICYMDLDEDVVPKSDLDLSQICQFSFEAQLWPIKEYITLRASNMYKSLLFKNLLMCLKDDNVSSVDSKFVYKDLIQYLSVIINTLPSIPVKLYSLLSDFTLLDDSSKLKSLSEHWSEFWDIITLHLETSPITNPASWLNWSVGNMATKDVALFEDMDHKLDTFSMDFPHITYNTVKLILHDSSIVSKDSDSSKVSSSLVAWRGRSKQLEYLHNLLWRNMDLMNVPCLRNHISDANTIVINFERTILCLEKALNRNSIIISGDLVTSVRNCTSKINEVFVAKNTFANREINNMKNHLAYCLNECIGFNMQLMEMLGGITKEDETFKEHMDCVLATAKLWILLSSCSVTIFCEIGSMDPVTKNSLKLDSIEEDVAAVDNLLDLHLMHNVIGGLISVSKDESTAIMSWNQGFSLTSETFISQDKKEVQLEKDKIYRRLSESHSHCGHLVQLKDKTKMSAANLSKGFTYRPPESDFMKLSKEFKHFTNSLASPNVILKHYNNMVDLAGNLLNYILSNGPYDSNIAVVLNKACDAVRECSTWQLSVKSFYTKISKSFTLSFPDVTKSLLNAITQLSYGFGSLKNSLVKMITMIRYGKYEAQKVDVWMEDLVRFPVIDKRTTNMTSLVDFYTSKTLADFLKMFNTVENKIDKIECFRLLKVSLQELYFGCVSRSSLHKDTWDAFCSILNEMVVVWQKQQQAIDKKKQDDDLLYVTKTKCDDKTEEEQLEDEFREMFPSYSDLDFADFKVNLLEQNKMNKRCNLEQKSKDKEDLVTYEDIVQIASLHSQLVTAYTCSEWMASKTNCELYCDYLTPLLERYSTFSVVLDGVSRGLNESLDTKLLPSLMILVANARGCVDGEDYTDLKKTSQDSKPNFYHDSWVSETKKCLPILDVVKSATLELLKQWPDFPILKDILTVVNRVLDFPLTSSVARFLTGIELLRDKIEEWNKAAHKGNAMIDIAVSVAQHIVTWRKLELSNWRDCLNHTFNRCQSEANKWWFHIYTLIECFIMEKSIGNSDNSETDKKDVMTIQQLTVAMQNFMEKSTLGEFEKRLNILYTFHCHVIHLKSSVRRDQAMFVLWNLFTYYSQFSPQISNGVKEKRTPIEKKLRDFVKICTWERDLSYWAVKELVEKAHRILHKHIKEFEVALKVSAYNFMSVDKITEQISSPVGIWDRPKRVTATPQYHFMVDPQMYVTSVRGVKKYFVELDDSSEEKYTAPAGNVVLLPSMPSLLTKAKNLCKQTILSTSYPVLIQSLDGFVTEVIETSKHLRELEISPGLPKPKQKAEAKAYLQRKKKALADLFRILTKMGISYRAGLVHSAAKEGAIISFMMPPINLKAAFSYLKNKRCDNVMLSVWEGCETHYQRSIARMGTLTGALISPSADLGPQNIERCKGFAVHLMIMVQEQKKKIAKSTRHFCLLRNHIGVITSLCESEGHQPKQSRLQSKLNMLQEVYAFVTMTLEQFKLLLKAFPNRNANLNEEQIAFDPTISESPIVDCYKNDAMWANSYSLVNQILTVLSKQKSNINKLTSIFPTVYNCKKTENLSNSNIFCYPQVVTLDDAFKQLKDIVPKIDSLISTFKVDLKSTSPGDSDFRSPINNCLYDLKQYLTDKIDSIGENMSINDLEMMVESSPAEFTVQVESVISSVLFTIQEIYKKHLNDKTDSREKDAEESNATSEGVTNGDDEEHDDQIIENHLRKELQESLFGDVGDLNMPRLINRLDLIVTELKVMIENDEAGAVECKKQLIRCLPLLDQMSLLAQFFVTQQVAMHRVSCKMLSVLLNIFTELASKGFCIPSEFGEEAGEGEGPGKMSGGMGLADGEGEKDVSERIENQDQLDDAKMPGDEKKEKDRDCKEEEKGINMTDDFDSHLQDVEPKGSDQESDDEDDPDKQMGETESGVDKLDQQIWGSEDEEEENDDKDNEKQEKEEEKGSGKPLGDKQMGAKEDGEQEDEVGKEGDKKKENKKDINEMEEPEYDEDQVDPYHGKQQPLPEPEPMDLPEDLNIDEQGDKDEDKEEDDKNPFEIDVFDEKKQPPEKDQETEKESKDEKGAEQSNEGNEDDSGDETDGDESGEKQDDQQKDMNADEDEEEGPEEDGVDNKQDEENPETEEIEENNIDEQQKPPQIPDDETSQKDEEENASDDDDNERKTEKEEARPSHDKPSNETNVENSAMEKGTKDSVQTNPQIDKEDQEAPFEQSQEQDGEEKDNVGQSELSQNQKGHQGDREDKPQSSVRENQTKKNERNEKKNRPGNSEQDRALGEVKEPAKKKMKMLNIQDNNKDANEEEEDDKGFEENEDQDQDADAYQHIKQAKKNDIQAIDAATKEQAEQQPIPNQPEEEGESVKSDDDIAMDDTEDVKVEEALDKLEAEKVGKDKKKENKEQQGKEKGDPSGEEPTGESGVEVEGENVLTLGADRGTDTSYHTQMDMVRVPLSSIEHSGVTASTVREALQNRATDGSAGDDGSRTAWHTLWGKTAAQARLLTERLRLVLEPTGLSRLAGDYRTGRRINMRRVIPYIASHFRKDRIWLRRTRPARREYHIAVAIDDSSSMCDNRSKELAFESLALVSQALNLLEAGELAVLSYGENVQILHSFGEQFTESSGSKILQNLTFQQTKTKIAKLINFSSAMFEEQCAVSNAPNAKLLLIVGDGRGIFSEGETEVTQAIRRARQQGVFMVYLVVDNPDSKVSIMDIRTPVFNPVTQELQSISLYLDSFPFPFYLILRDINALPAVLSDALRQWFELAANIDKQ